MIAPSAASFVLILAFLSVGQTSTSAVKGHSTQQRAEQAPVKSPALQQQQLKEQAALERQPKSASPAQAGPILESSKKVYNDESIRRSAAVQQQFGAEPSAKSAPVPVASEPVVQAAPVVKAVEPVAEVKQQQPPAQVDEAVSAKKAPEQAASVEAKSAPVAKSAAEESAGAKAPEPVVAKVAKEELPAQSVRSMVARDEQPSKVIVEHVVPAKVAEVVEPQPVAAPPAVVPPVVIEHNVQQPVVLAKPVEQPVPPVQAPAQEPVVPVAAPVVVPVAVVAPAESPLEAKKDEQSAAPAKSEAEPAPIEVPAPDPGLVLSEPIDSTTKLLIDLDEHVQKFLPAEDKQEPVAPAKEQVLVNGVDYSPAASGAEQQPSGKSNAPLVPYSSSDSEPIVPPLPQSIDKVEKASGAAAASPSAAGQAGAQQAANTRQASHQNQNQQQVITQLLDQLDSLQNRIQDTINQLVARRRYVMSALLRPMGTYVRRVRTNLERLQNRVNQLQAAAVSVGGNQNGQRPGGLVDAAAIETIRRRIEDISKRISDIVNRIRFSLTPTSAPLNNNGR